MSRRATAVNPQSAIRLKQLYDEYNMSQAEFSKKTGISQNTLSRICNGKHPLTQSIAQVIVDAFPEINLEWLMCIGEDMTESRRFSRIMAETNAEGQLLLAGTTAFASLAGYEITPPKIQDHQNIEGLLGVLNAGYRISKGAQTISLSLGEMNRFENEVFDFVELKFKHLFAEKGAGGNG